MENLKVSHKDQRLFPMLGNFCRRCVCYLILGGNRNKIVSLIYALVNRMSKAVGMILPMISEQEVDKSNNKSSITPCVQNLFGEKRRRNKAKKGIESSNPNDSFPQRSQHGVAVDSK